VSATSNRAIGRRDFLVRLFRGPSRVTASPVPGDPAHSAVRRRAAEGTSRIHDADYQTGTHEAERAGRDFTAPRCAPESLASQSKLERVLQAMDDWTGIEDP